MTEDAISRTGTIEALEKRWAAQKELLREFPQVPHHYYDGNLEARAVVNSMPPVRPERRKARWMSQGYFEVPVSSFLLMCSTCKGHVKLRIGFKEKVSFSEGFGRYCPWCGAEMEERTQEDNQETDAVDEE